MHTTRGLAGAAMLACVLAGCAVGGSKPQDVTVTPAGPRTITDYPGGVGTTAPGLSVPVSVDYRDTVTAVDVQVGSVVQKGQALLSLDPAPFKAQVASLQQKEQLIQAEIGNAETRQAAAQAQGNQAEAAVYGLQIQTYQGEYIIDQQQVTIAQGHATQLLAPVAGIVGEVKVTPQFVASPGQILVTVTDVSSIDVTASLPVTDRPFVKVGAPATISVTPPPGGTNSGPVLQGTVQQVAPAASGAGLFFQATVQAPNTAGETVQPGSQAYVRVTVTHNSPVVVPEIAVLNADTTPTVYVVDGDVVHPHAVTVGVSDGKYDEILSGLSPGDLCVIVGNQLLTDGSRVRVTQTFP